MAEKKKQMDEQNAPAMLVQEESEETIDLIELLYRLLVNWKLIAGSAIAVAIVAALVTLLLMTPMYEATSTIYVLSRSDSAINMSDLQIGTALTSDYIKVFDMWEVHEGVISNLNLPYDYEEMRDMLTVTNDADTRMLDITITSPSAEEAAMIANEYADVASRYIEETMSTDRPNIMSTALVPVNPVSPNKTLNVLLGFVLGGILAAGVVVVRTIMDDKYKTAEEIRKYTGLITLATVPLEGPEVARDKAREKNTSRTGRRDRT